MIEPAWEMDMDGEDGRYIDQYIFFEDVLLEQKKFGVLLSRRECLESKM